MFGVVWLAFTLGLYFFLKSSAVPDMEFPTLSVGIGALFLVAGVPMLISGLINARKRQGEENKVMAQGVATTGKVTFC